MKDNVSSVESQMSFTLNPQMIVIDVEPISSTPQTCNYRVFYEGQVRGFELTSYYNIQPGDSIIVLFKEQAYRVYPWPYFEYMNFFNNGVSVPVKDLFNRLAIEEGKPIEQVIPVSPWGLDTILGHFRVDDQLGWECKQGLKPLWNKLGHLLSLFNIRVSVFYESDITVYQLLLSLQTNSLEIREITVNKALEVSVITGVKATAFTLQTRLLAQTVFDNRRLFKWTCTPVDFLLAVNPTLHLHLPDLPRYGIKPLTLEDQVDNRYWYPTQNLEVEIRVATRICQLLRNSYSFGAKNRAYVARKARLTKDQSDTLNDILTRGVSIITGEAGSGKTHTLLATIHACHLEKIPFRVLAPTGKAVYRIQELMVKYYGQILVQPTTIHMALYKYDPNFELVFFEEASMISTQLFDRFLTRYPHVWRMAFFGDLHQIPPIAWGHLLHQLSLLPELIPTHHLTHNFRVSNTVSPLLTLLRSMRDVERRQKKQEINWNLTEVHSGDHTTLQAIVNNLFQQGIDSNNITVLSPTNMAVANHNRHLRSLFNPQPQCVVNSRNDSFSVGDRVMMLKNDYLHQVMNGCQGTVVNITVNLVRVDFKNCLVDFTYHSLSALKTRVSFDMKSLVKALPEASTEAPPDPCYISPSSIDYINRLVAQMPTPGKTNKTTLLNTKFDPDNFACDARNWGVNVDQIRSLDHITPAYALTIDKSQGSEYPVCIVYLSESDLRFLDYRRLYTAMSRTQDKLIIIVDHPHPCKFLTQVDFRQPIKVQDNLARYIKYLLFQIWDEYTGVTLTQLPDVSQRVEHETSPLSDF